MALAHLLEARCPRCGNISAVRICRSPANYARSGANVLLGFLGLMTLEPFFVLVRKCISCDIYFHKKEIWTRPGECINCGYNLTGNTSGVCPECGRRLTQPPNPA
jgi:predicted RNA-binding Zn-ribbon protein involved in translation (DUF1610 family)